jgi:hypothetical protein
VGRRRTQQRDKQANRAIRRLRGDEGEILFPDRGARALRIRIQKYQHRPGDGYGSHQDGRHKLG